MPATKMKRSKSTKGPIESRKVSQLRAYPRQRELFGEPTTEAVNELAQSIADVGLLHPIEILPTDVVIAGHTRLTAVDQLGWKEVPCIVRNDLAAQGEEAILEHVVRDNLVRRQLSRLAQTRLMLMLQGHTPEQIARYGLSANERDRVGSLLGMSGRNLSRWIRILALPTELQDAVDRKEITLEQAGQISYRRPEELAEIAAAIRQGKPIAEVLTRVTKAGVRSDDEPTAAFRRLAAGLAQSVDRLQGRTGHIRSSSIRQRLGTIKAARKLLRELDKLGSADPMAASSEALKKISGRRAK